MWLGGSCKPHDASTLHINGQLRFWCVWRPSAVCTTTCTCRLSQVPQRSGRLILNGASVHYRSCHRQVTPEAHRELNNALERGAQPPVGAAAGLPGGPWGAGKGEDPRHLAPVVLMDEG